jgi:hypothetical protein
MRECGAPEEACMISCHPARLGPGLACGSDVLGSCVVRIGYPDGSIDGPLFECDGSWHYRRCGEHDGCGVACDPERIPSGTRCDHDLGGLCLVDDLDAGPERPDATPEWLDSGPGWPDAGIEPPICDGGSGFVRICGHGPEACSAECDPSAPPPGATCSTDLYGSCAFHPMACDGGGGFVRECGRGPRSCAIPCDPARLPAGVTCGSDEHGSCFVDALDAG